MEVITGLHALVAFNHYFTADFASFSCI